MDRWYYNIISGRGGLFFHPKIKGQGMNELALMKRMTLVNRDTKNTPLSNIGVRQLTHKKDEPYYVKLKDINEPIDFEKWADEYDEEESEELDQLENDVSQKLLQLSKTKPDVPKDLQLSIRRYQKDASNIILRNDPGLRETLKSLNTKLDKALTPKKVKPSEEVIVVRGKKKVKPESDLEKLEREFESQSLTTKEEESEHEIELYNHIVNKIKSAGKAHGDAFEESMIDPTIKDELFGKDSIVCLEDDLIKPDSLIFNIVNIDNTDLNDKDRKMIYSYMNSEAYGKKKKYECQPFDMYVKLKERIWALELKNYGTAYSGKINIGEMKKRYNDALKFDDLEEANSIGIKVQTAKFIYKNSDFIPDYMSKNNKVYLNNISFMVGGKRFKALVKDENDIIIFVLAEDGLYKYNITNDKTITSKNLIDRNTGPYNKFIYNALDLKFPIITEIDPLTKKPATYYVIPPIKFKKIS